MSQAALGAAIGALAVLLGGLLTRRHEHRRWLLDGQLEAYADFAGEVYAWMLAFYRAGRVTEELNDNVHAVDRARHRIALLAPRTLREKADKITQAVLDVMEYIEPEGTDSRLAHKPKINNIATSVGELIDVAGVDLRRSSGSWLTR